MTTVSEIPVVQLPALDADDVLGEAPSSIWAMEVPSGKRPSPLTLAVLGVVAGVAAMALGAAAVISASSSTESSPGSNVGVTTTPQPSPSIPTVEQRVLAMLAKPSTVRIAFRGAPGLVLVVGSAGRAAILVRGIEPASADTPYGAWIVRPGSAPVLGARFAGNEPAVFLSRRLGPRASVVISARRPAAGPPARNAIAALRD